MKSKISREQAERLLESISPRSSNVSPYSWEACVAYMQGDSLHEIGLRLNGSRTKASYVIEATPYSLVAIREKRATFVRNQEELEKRRALEWSHNNVGKPIIEGSIALDINEERLEQLLGRRRYAHRSRIVRQVPKRATDDEIMGNLKQFIKEVEPPHSAPKYKAWADAHNCVGPQTVRKRLGSWSGVINGLGGMSTVYERNYRRAFDTDTTLQVIVPIFRENPDLSYQAYEQMSLGRADLPSTSTVRNRVDPIWANVQHEVLQIIAGTHPKGQDWIRKILSPPGDIDPLHLEYDVTAEQAREIVSRAIHDIGGEISTSRYKTWSSENNVNVPVFVLCNRTSMRWSDLVRSCEGEVSSRIYRYGKEEVNAALDVFASECSNRSVQSYLNWREVRLREVKYVPSHDTILRHYGSWKNVIAYLENTRTVIS